MEASRMWFLVIPFVMLSSFWGAGPVAAEASGVIGRVTWGGSEPRTFATGEGTDVRGKGSGERGSGGREVRKVRRVAGASGGSDGDGPRLDVNACSFEDLLRLPGIGPKKARAILEERERRPFRSVHDLKRVKGIGAKTIQRLAPHVTIGRAVER